MTDSETTPDNPPDTEAAGSIGYAAAMAELTGIVSRLESEDLDVDQLEANVARAAELVTICRNRLDATRLRIDDIIAALPT